VSGESELETGDAGTTSSSVSDDLTLRAALYGLVIQSSVDKVCSLCSAIQVTTTTTTTILRPS